LSFFREGRGQISGNDAARPGVDGVQMTYDNRQQQQQQLGDDDDDDDQSLSSSQRCVSSSSFLVGAVTYLQGGVLVEFKA